MRTWPSQAADPDPDGEKPHQQLFIPQARIVGGSDTTAFQYPWYATTTGETALCGATLIASNLLLTAAHCQGDFLAGAHFLEDRFVPGSIQEVQNGIFVNVKEEFIHPQYDSTTYNYDYMVVELSDPVVGIPPVQLQLDPATTPSGGELLEAIGFGARYEGGPQSSMLQSLKGLKAVRHSSCQTLYGNRWPISEDTMLW